MRVKANERVKGEGMLVRWCYSYHGQSMGERCGLAKEHWCLALLCLLTNNVITNHNFYSEKMSSTLHISTTPPMITGGVKWLFGVLVLIASHLRVWGRKG